MPILFRSLLAEAGLDPGSAKVLRHNHVSRSGDLLAVWRKEPELFERYQAIQLRERRSYFARAYWASFIAQPSGAACFVGVYTAQVSGPAPPGYREPLGRVPPDPLIHDLYAYQRTSFLQEFIGRLFIAGWSGQTWTRNAEGAHEVVELARSVPQPAFPGLLELVQPLSEIPYLPEAWLPHLRQGRGVYLLTCPRTREQYVGKADGEGGFYGRWLDYVANGHGGNTRLKSREPSDYQVSVLEVAGSAVGSQEIGAMEERWKRKLQSRDMGLNAN